MELNEEISFLDLHYHTRSGAPSDVHNGDLRNPQILRVRNILVQANHAEDAEGSSGLPFSAGIHPQDYGNPDFGQLEELLQNPFCIAVGECGLDRRFPDMYSKQTEIFIKQVELSEEYRKPMIIHCVRAYPEIMRIRKDIMPYMPWILHGYRGNEKKTMELAEAGFFFSFGHGLLLSSATMEPFFHQIPEECIFCETDESCEDIRKIYAEAALLTRKSMPEFCRLTCNNFKKVFCEK